MMLQEECAVLAKLKEHWPDCVSLSELLDLLDGNKSLLKATLSSLSIKGFVCCCDFSPPEPNADESTIRVAIENGNLDFKVKSTEAGISTFEKQCKKGKL